MGIGRELKILGGNLGVDIGCFGRDIEVCRGGYLLDIGKIFVRY